MPMNVKPENITGISTNLNVDLTPGVTPTGLTDQLVSAMALDNVPFAAGVRGVDEALQAAAAPSGPRVPFDVLAQLTEAERFRASDFADVETPEGLADVRRRSAREDEMRQSLGNGPLPAILATTLAVLTDPTSYLPLLGAAGKASLGVKAARVGAITAAEVGAQEAALHALQETRTIEESVAAVLLGGAFGMTIGGVVAARGAGSALPRAINARTLKNATSDAATIMRAEFPQSTVGAARVQTIDPEDTKLASSLGGVAVVKQTLGRVRLTSASFDILTGPFAAARKSLLRLVDPGLVTKGVMRGAANPQAIEIRITGHDAVIANINQSFHSNYRAYRNTGGGLSKLDFLTEVGRAAPRGDVHPNSHIEAAAKDMRKVFDTYKDDALTLNLLKPEDIPVKTSASYFSRFYKKTTIRARMPEFRTIVVKWLRESAPKEDPAELGGVADDIINTILGAPDGRTHIVGKVGGASPRARGPLKERTFNIPDALIEDFLERDAQVVINRYIRTMAADIEFAREFGEVDPTGALKAEIRDETTTLVIAAKSEKERLRLSKEGERAEAIIEDLVNQLRGVRGDMNSPLEHMTKQTLRSLRNINFATKLGGVMISSIPDVGKIVMEEGLARTLGTVMAEFGRGFKGIRMGAKEAQEFGGALDFTLSTRVRRVLDLSERHEVQTKMDRFERGTSNLASLAAQATLINFWNTAGKSVTATIAGTRILGTARKIVRGEKLTKFELQRLAEGGISHDMARRIADQSQHWSEFGEGWGRVTIGNAGDWADREASDVFGNALLRDINNTIITPGVGDAPLWTSGEWGKTIFQFKKFSAAATNRILISGLQKRDMATLNGMLVMVGMGALAVALKDIVAGGEVRKRSGRQWAADAVDRSGIVAMFYEMDALMEKGLGVSPITAAAGQDVSRFAGRDLLAQLGGPTAGLVGDVAMTARSALAGDFTQSDLHKMRRLVPMQNVFYARWMFDQMENGIAKAFNLPKKQPRRRAVAAPTFGE